MLTLSTLIERDLDHGAAVVTPSPQRATAVRLAYGVGRMARGERAWRTPDALAWPTWLEREAFRAADAGQLVPRPLRAAEEWLLWLEAAADAMAAQDARPSGAGSSELLADSLRRAARVMFDWGIPLGALRGSARSESELLARALARVETRSREAGAAPSHALGALLRGFRSGPVTFAGFAECSAVRGAWLREAPQRLPAVREHWDEEAPGRALTVRASDPAEELELAASWCRSRLAKAPGDRLLVVVPDLAACRGEAVRTFEHALAPRAALNGEEAGCVVVEGGEALAGYPLVRHGLATLRFLTGALGLEELSAWLRASFWRAPAEAQRARLDIWLRHVLGIEATPRQLVQALRGAPAGLGAAASELAGSLEAAARALEPMDEAGPIRRWTQGFERALAALGWPGARPLTSAEQQTKVRFAELLAELVAAGGALGALEGPQAVRTLHSLAARTSFAPQSGDAAVTLTGALSDPIVRYDGIWIAGLHAEAWPPPAMPNPFIPLSAQISAGVPGSTAAGNLDRARGLLDRWRHAAPELILSSPAHLDDLDCLVSPLVAELPGIEAWTPSERPVSPAQRIRATRRIEAFVDDRGLPWPAGAPLPAGTRALDYQSRCPFRAYAELRLSCVPLEAPRPGLDPRERGRLMHRALEHLWRELGGSERLQRESLGGGLGRLIDECVARAAGESPAAPLTPAAEAGRRRELRRIARLLLDLAALEGERPPFRVRALELTRSLTLAGARLDLRIDRIDELDDGTRIILDYKTGKPAALDWLSDRLSDPQLLVYLLATGGHVGALAAVHLTAAGIAYRGMADRPGRLPRVPGIASVLRVPSEAGDAPAAAAWRDQVRRWGTLLERLARDFLSGSAAVDPVESACRICHLQTFCRVSEIPESRDG